MTDTEVRYVECKSCNGSGEVDPTEQLDIDDLDALRKELRESAAYRGEITGLDCNRRGERIRTASRIAWLANRIAWLEACEVIRADDEVTWAEMRKATAEKRAAAERDAWEAEHLGPDGDYVDLGGGRAVKKAEYDEEKHGPAIIRGEDGEVLVNQAAIDHGKAILGACTECGRSQFSCQTLKELGGQDDSGERCCGNCTH